MPFERRALWEQLFADMSQFEDCRNFKATYGGQTPDFRHLKTGDGLWWVILNLQMKMHRPSQLLMNKLHHFTHPLQLAVDPGL